MKEKEEKNNLSTSKNVKHRVKKYNNSPEMKENIFQLIQPLVLVCHIDIALAFVSQYIKAFW